MTRNVGSTDRIARLLVGIVLLGLAFFSGMPLFAAGLGKAVAVLVGLILLGTAMMNFCPLYRLLGVNTCKV
ncbi:MAG: DUF2892 domain-containing protein [Granulosicoccus sp.]|nr:DUF2892 domain-containing protein [Granulosicoccus sp.]